MFLTRWLLIACATSLLFCASCSKREKGELTSLKIGTGESGGLYAVTGQAIADLVNAQTAKTGLVMRVEETSGSVFNINAVVVRGLQFGLAQMNRQAEAVEGRGFWEGMPQERLRFVCSLYPESVAILVLADSGINALADLKGKVVSVGPPGSGSQGDAIAILKAAGLESGKDYQTDESAPTTGLQLLQAGKVAALVYTSGELSPLLQGATTGSPAVRLLPVENREALLREERTMEAATLPEGVETVSVRTVLLTSVEVPDQVVYDVTRAIFDHLEEFEAGHPQFGDLKAEEMVQGSIAPIHPGALKFYQKQKLIKKSADAGTNQGGRGG